MKTKLLIYSFLLIGIVLMLTNGCSKNDSSTTPITTDDGSTWSVLGTLNANNSVLSLCSDANNNIYAAGSFKNASDYYSVAKWNGSSWTDIGINANNIIREICTDVNGNLYAIGDFTDTNNNYYIAKWNGSSWTDTGLNANDYIYNICTDPSNNLYAVGGFTDGATTSDGNNYVAKWNGSLWSNLGGLVGTGNGGALCTDAGGKVYVSGFNSTNGIYVAVHN